MSANWLRVAKSWVDRKMDRSYWVRSSSSMSSSWCSPSMSTPDRGSSKMRI